MVLERTEAVLLRVRHAGDHLVCLASRAPLGDAELEGSFEPRGGDPDEIEVVPDPRSILRWGDMLHCRGGDPDETEVVPDPREATVVCRGGDPDETEVIPDP